VNPAPAQPSGSQPAPSGAPQVAAGELVTQLKGTVIPSLQITISPRDVAAEITNINFVEGQRVKQNDLLATLLDAQYANRLKTEEAAVAAAKAMVTRAKAAKASAEAKVAKSEAALAATEARVVRAVSMQERADKDYAQAVEQRKAGAISAQEYQKFEADKRTADADKVAADEDVKAARREIEAAKAEVNTAIANIASAEADQRAAEARRDEAARLVKNCEVRAPIAGTILTKSADKGALVSPMSFNVAAGICTIADLSKLEVEIDVPERQITRIEKGQACVLQADADPTREYRGVVDRVMPIADDTKNVVKVRIRVYLRATEEQGTFLKPKMSVTASVYNRPFAFDSAKDQAWGDEKK
jgi:multidrug resistance efflux pump